MFYSFLVFFFIVIILFFNFKKKKISQLSCCCICEEVFEDKNIFNANELTFCKKHFDFFNSHHWTIHTSLNASSDNSENAMTIYELKHQLQKNGEDCFIKTSYQEKGNQIISRFDLYVITKQKKEGA